MTEDTYTVEFLPLESFVWVKWGSTADRDEAWSLFDHFCAFVPPPLMIYGGIRLVLTEGQVSVLAERGNIS